VSIENLRRTWDTLGRKDPLWAVLSDPAKRNNRWDQQEFFRTGEDEIAALFRDLDARGLSVNRHRCLDFGCGVGRVAQALCGFFDQVDGVDIAQSMIDRARDLNQHGDRCRYHLNVRTDLGTFEDGSFDFVYSNIVLQHMAPEIAEGYIGEFVRVLAPAGMTVFQVPSRFVGPKPLSGSGHQAQLRLVAPVGTRRLQPGSRAQLTVEVTNASPVVWDHSAPLRVGNHWLDEGGQMISLDDGRTPLGRQVDPGERLLVELTVTAPERPGRYILEVDVVEEGVTWFGAKSSGTLRCDVEVGTPRPGSVALRHLRGLTRHGAEVLAARRSSSPFEMHAVPKDRVVEVIETAGADVLAIEDFDVSGPGWENYRYFVRRPVALA
jgi:SAM-dependent methyltransferase